MAKGTKIRITESLVFDVSKVSHGLTIGSTGSGKSFFINSKILAYSQMSDIKFNSWNGADIRICDPKASDLYFLIWQIKYKKANNIFDYLLILLVELVLYNMKEDIHTDFLIITFYVKGKKYKYRI